MEKCKQFRNSVKISFWRCLLSEIKSDLISYGSEVKGGHGAPIVVQGKVAGDAGGCAPSAATGAENLETN